MKLELPQNSWHGDKPFSINVPNNWNIEIASSKGDSLFSLSKKKWKKLFKTLLDVDH